MNFGLICCQILVKKWSKMTSFLIFSKSPSNQSIDPFFQSITYVTLYESSHESFRNLALFRGLFLVVCWLSWQNQGLIPPKWTFTPQTSMLNKHERTFAKTFAARVRHFFELTILSPKLSSKLFNQNNENPLG